MASTTSYLRDANCSNGSSGGGSSSSSLWKKRVHASNNLYRSFNNNDNDDNRKVLNILIASTHKGEESLIASIFNDIGTQHRVIYVPRHPERVNDIVLELSTLIDGCYCCCCNRYVEFIICDCRY